MTNFNNQIISLSGVLKSALLVNEVAFKGKVELADLKCLMDSLLITNPKTPLDVYSGNVKNIIDGLNILELFLNKQSKNISPNILRYTFSLITLEKQLKKRKDLLNIIGDRLVNIQRQSNHFEITHPTIVSAYASIYEDTLSTFRYRIQVRGNPSFLKIKTNAECIRALLLSGIRSANLWRQLGGRKWQLLFQQKKIKESIHNIKHNLLS